MIIEGPELMRYCKLCLLPDTKPDLRFNEDGVCAACLNFQERKSIDWSRRAEDFLSLVESARAQGGSSYDCIVPVSGGKDSTYQVIKLLELGVRPLAVTATTCDLSEIGRINIENIKSLGVDHLTVSPNPLIRRKLNRIGLQRVGDIAWPEHVGIFTIPVRVAVQYGISLLVWGENSQNEYGGPSGASGNHILDRRWLEEFGGLLGLRVSDLPAGSGIDEKELYPYQYPSDEELRRANVTGVFLGHYFAWDGLSNALVAQAHGFRSYGRVIEGSMVDYENLDNYQHGIHDYLKYLKFGFGRATDIASMHIRRNRLTRSDAAEIVRVNEGKFPWTYLGKPLEDILDPLGIGLSEFREICDRFTNKKLFRTDSEGRLVRDDEGNLTKIKHACD